MNMPTDYQLLNQNADDLTRMEFCWFQTYVVRPYEDRRKVYRHVPRIVLESQNGRSGDCRRVLNACIEIEPRSQER